MSSRRFAFFERHALEAPRELGEGSAACCNAAGWGAAGTPLLFVGSSSGVVDVLDVRLRRLGGWRAHEGRCAFLAPLVGGGGGAPGRAGRSLLLTLGEEDAASPLASTTVKARHDHASRPRPCLHRA